MKYLRSARLFCSAFLVTASAWAQAPADEVKEEVIVTGSRIASPNATSTSPVQVVTEQEIKVSGKTDIVDTLQQVPPETIATQVAAFQAGGFKMKDLIYAVFTSDDFVRF